MTAEFDPDDEALYDGLLATGVDQPEQPDVCRRCARGSCCGDRETGDLCEYEEDEFDQPLVTPVQLQAAACEARVREIGWVVGRLAPPGIKWVLMAWEGDDVRVESNVADKSLRAELRRLLEIDPA